MVSQTRRPLQPVAEVSIVALFRDIDDNRDGKITTRLEPQLQRGAGQLVA